MKIIKKIGPAIFFIFFFLLSYRKFFLSPGTLGHNWDWVFPNLSVLFANFNRLNLYAWNTFNLGEITHLTLSHLIPASLFTFLSGFVGPHWLELGFLLAVHVASFLSFKRFLAFISGYSSSLHFLPAFLYAFSPFLFNDIIGGSYVMWLSYGLLPLYFTFLINFIREGKVKNLAVLTVVSVFVIVSLQHFVLINAVAVAYLAWERIFGEIKKPLPVIIKRFLFFAGVEILTNLYWLLPLGYSLVDFTKGAVLKDSGMYEFDSVRFSQQSLWNIFNLAGYLDRNMYLFSLPEALKILFPVATGFLWLMIFYALAKKGNFKKSGSFYFWLFLFLLTAFLVKGGNRPFPDVTLWLYQHLPFMRMFRSPQHLMALPAFILPVLFSFALFSFPQKKNLAAVFFALMIFTGAWWANGDLGSKTLLQQEKDHLDLYELAPELVEFYQQSQADRSDGRTFFLPAVFSPTYLETEYQKKGQGIQPGYLYLNQPTFTSEANPFAETGERGFCPGETTDYLPYLSLFAVKNIVSRFDISPFFTPAATCWDNETVRKKLADSSCLEVVFEKKYAGFYRVKNECFLPRFYVPAKTVLAVAETDFLPEVAALAADKEKPSVVYLKGSGDSKEVLSFAEEIFIQGTLSVSSGSYLPFAVSTENAFLHTPNESSIYRFAEIRNETERKLNGHLFLSRQRVGALQINPGFIYDYENEMEGAMSLLPDLAKEDAQAFFVSLAKIESFLVHDRKSIDNSAILHSEEKDSLRRAFILLQEKAKLFRPVTDLSNLTYLSRVPEDGVYSVMARKFTNDGKTEKSDWADFGENYFSRGEQKFVLPVKSVGVNLLDKNGEISPYGAGALYQIKFDYRLGKGGGRFAVKEDIGNRERILSFTGDDFEHFEIFFLSSQRAKTAKIVLPPDVEVKNLTMERIFQPETVLFKKEEAKKASLPKITFSKINPAKYRVRVENADGPYRLVFSENFHKGWRAYFDKVDSRPAKVVASYFNDRIKEELPKIGIETAWETWGKRSLTEERHFLANGYANGWEIAPQDGNGEKNYELIIEFYPQRFFYWGLAVSAATFAVIFLLAGRGRIKKMGKS